MGTDNKRVLAKSSNAGAGIAGFIGFTALFAMATVLFITENYFVSMLLLSLALLVYVAGHDSIRIFLSSINIFFSSRHLVERANYIDEVLTPMRVQLQLSPDGRLAKPPSEPTGKTIVLPENPLANDIQKLIQEGRGFDSFEYLVHSYYVDCHELYDNASANLDFIAVSMPVFGLIGTVLGLIAMFDNLGGDITIGTLSPQLAMALKTTLYGALFSAVYKILCSRFERRIRNMDYDYETLCRGLQVLVENKMKVEIAS